MIISQALGNIFNPTFELLRININLITGQKRKYEPPTDRKGTIDSFKTAQSFKFRSEEKNIAYQPKKDPKQ